MSDLRETGSETENASEESGVMELIRLRAELSQRDKRIAELEQPLHDFVENMNDQDETMYVHHPKCHGACDYCCSGLFFEKCQRVDGPDVLYAPRYLEHQLREAWEEIAHQKAEREVNAIELLREMGVSKTLEVKLALRTIITASYDETAGAVDARVYIRERAKQALAEVTESSQPSQ